MTSIFRRGVLAAIVLAAIVPAGRAAAPPVQTVLGAGTIYRTPYYVIRGKAAGPVALIQAGIHGDEPAGTYALAELVQTIEIRNGTAILIPRLNEPALAQERRFINTDLNRAFADGGRTRPYEYALAKEIMALAGREKIDYVVTLHEARRAFDPAVEKSLGQTICYGVDPAPPVLQDWLTRLNAAIAPPQDKFTGKYFPIPTSSTEVLVAKFHLRGGFCVETWSGLPLDRRIAYQRMAVESFLAAIGIGFRYAPPHPAPQRTLPPRP